MIGTPTNNSARENLGRFQESPKIHCYSSTGNRTAPSAPFVEAHRAANAAAPMALLFGCCGSAVALRYSDEYLPR
jgi:hypothetical protein